MFGLVNMYFGISNSLCVLSPHCFRMFSSLDWSDMFDIKLRLFWLTLLCETGSTERGDANHLQLNSRSDWQEVMQRLCEEVR